MRGGEREKHHNAGLTHRCLLKMRRCNTTCNWSPGNNLMPAWSLGSTQPGDPPVAGTGCLGRSALAARGAPDAAAMLAAMADAASGELLPRQPLLPLSNRCCCCCSWAGLMPSSGASSRPQAAPMPICSSAMAAMPSSRVGSGMAARVEATCEVGTQRQIGSNLATCPACCKQTLHGGRWPADGNTALELAHLAKQHRWDEQLKADLQQGFGAAAAASLSPSACLAVRSRPDDQTCFCRPHPSHAAPPRLTLLITVAVLLGMRPDLSSQPTTAQMRNSLKLALVVAASTTGSMAPCSEAAAACADTAALAAAPTPPPGRAATQVVGRSGRLWRAYARRGSGRSGRREGRRRPAAAPPMPVGRAQSADDEAIVSCWTSGKAWTAVAGLPGTTQLSFCQGTLPGGAAAAAVDRSKDATIAAGFGALGRCTCALHGGHGDGRCNPRRSEAGKLYLHPALYVVTRGAPLKALPFTPSPQSTLPCLLLACNQSQGLTNSSIDWAAARPGPAARARAVALPQAACMQALAIHLPPGGLHQSHRTKQLVRLVHGRRWALLPPARLPPPPLPAVPTLARMLAAPRRARPATNPASTGNQPQQHWAGGELFGTRGARQRRRPPVTAGSRCVAGSCSTQHQHRGRHTGGPSLRPSFSPAAPAALADERQPGGRRHRRCKRCAGRSARTRSRGVHLWPTTQQQQQQRRQDKAAAGCRPLRPPQPCRRLRGVRRPPLPTDASRSAAMHGLPGLAAEPRVPPGGRPAAVSQRPRPGSAGWLT